MEALVIGGAGAFDFYEEKYGHNELAADLTIAPMSVSYMFRVLKNYHSYLKTQGTVVLMLHPYSLCIDHYIKTPIVSKDIRFYPVLHNAMIENFDSALSSKWSRKQMPTSLKDVSKWIQMTCKHYTVKDEKSECLNVLCQNIKLDSTISEKLKQTIKENVSTIKELNEFAEERGYKVKIVLMRSFFKGSALEQYESILNEVFYTPLTEANLVINE